MEGNYIALRAINDRSITNPAALAVVPKRHCPDCGSELAANGVCPHVDRTSIGLYMLQRKACGHFERSARPWWAL